MKHVILPGAAVLSALLIAISGLAGSAAHAEDQKVPLKVSLPRAYFSSTPLEYDNPGHFEGPRYKPREQFLAPKDAVNLSLGKPVTSSVKPNYGKLEQITDGKIGQEADNVVELKPGLQWVQIDLGKPCVIYAVAVWHFYNNDRVYKDVVVQVADDPEFTKNVQTIFNNDYDNSTKLGVGKDLEYIDNFEGRIMDAKNAKGQYVRLYSNGNTTDECNHYIEVEVWGKPAQP